MFTMRENITMSFSPNELSLIAFELSYIISANPIR